MERTFEVYEEKTMEKKIKWKQKCLHFILRSQRAKVRACTRTWRLLRQRAKLAERVLSCFAGC